MRKILFFVALVFGLVACNTDNPTPPSTEGAALSVTSDTTVWFEAAGGEGVITYTIENPVKGAQLEAESSVEWISNINVGTNEVTYVVEANDVEEERRGVITLTYGADNSCTVSILQRANINVDVEFEVKSLDGSYYLDKLENADTHNYNLTLSDKGYNQSGNLYADASYYILDIYVDTPAEGGVATLPAGEYYLAAGNATGVINNGYSKFVDTHNGGSTLLFTDARLIVGEGTLEAYITLENGKVHHLTYEGSLVVEPYKADDNSGYSTLRRDYSFDISGGLFVGAYVGNMYYSNADTCQVYLFEDLDVVTGEERGDEFQLDLQLPRGTTDICGTYTPGTSAGHFLIGSVENLGDGQYMQTNTWYMTAGYLDFAPLIDGTITVTKDDADVYTFVIDCVDDEGHKISGTFRGMGEFIEW